MHFFWPNTIDILKTQDQQENKRYWKSTYITSGSLDAWVKLDSRLPCAVNKLPLQSDSEKKSDLGILNHPSQYSKSLTMETAKGKQLSYLAT